MSDAIRIFKHAFLLVHNINNCYLSFPVDEFPQATIPLGGDQLVRIRVSGARDLRAGAHTKEERLETIFPEIVEFFHVQQDFMEVSNNSIYK